MLKKTGSWHVYTMGHRVTCYHGAICSYQHSLGRISAYVYTDQITM